jgi:hypothetical protein
MRRNPRILVALLSLALAPAASCDAPPSDPDWEAFMADARRDGPEGEYFVFEGDIRVSLEQLQALYERAAVQPRSAVALDGSAHDVWTHDEQRQLTYCINTSSFGAKTVRATREVAEAARAWELAANVDFIHVPSEDGSDCNGDNDDVLFAVMDIPLGKASAFLPSAPADERELWIDMDYFDASSAEPNQTTVGVFRHELGHILGLRHEHTRSPTSSCIEDDEWEALSTYDGRSVMHYKHCPGGVTTSGPQLTQRDIMGIAKLYGPSRVVASARRPQVDFNGDGRRDIGLTGPVTFGTVPLVLSNAQGGLTVTNQSAGSFASWAAREGVMRVHGDFNGDGRTDIALSGPSSWGTVPVAFSQGNGSFSVTNAVVPSLPSWASWDNARLLAADFDGDGDDDLALVGHKGMANIPVGLSAGNGTFAMHATAVGGFMEWASRENVRTLVGDFDGDGKADLALTGGLTWGTLPVALSDGAGGFAVHNHAVGSFATWAAHDEAIVVVGDFDGDGRDDVALTGPVGWGTIPIAFSNGDGTFDVTNLGSSGFSPITSFFGVSVLAGDFNDDGMTDLAAIGPDIFQALPVALSDGDGTFTVVVQAADNFPQAAGQGATPIVGDFDADEESDIALLGPDNWGNMPIVFSDGDGSFSKSSYALGGFPSWAGRDGVQIF